MPICRKCGKEFPNRLTIGGKLRNLQSRKFCINCSPFGGRNTRNLNEETDQGHRKCPRCKKTLPIENFYNRRSKTGHSSYCKQCTNLQTLERQRELKQKAVKYKGGKCVRCGYSHYIGALEFHHIDPNGKDVTISHLKHTTFGKIVPELDKCVLVCANCHREIHAELKGLIHPPPAETN